MRNTILDHIDSVSKYATSSILASTEFLRCDPPELRSISSISASMINGKPWIDAHCESEFDFDYDTKLLSEWLNDISWTKSESETSISHTWRTDAFTFVLWFWRKK